MTALDSSPRNPVTDSPWFWFYLFCTAALVALVLMRSKYGARQAQLEKQFQGRQHAAKSPGQGEAAALFSDARSTLIKLDPLYLLMGVGVAVGWITFCWQRLRKPPQNQTVEAPGRTS